MPIFGMTDALNNANQGRTPKMSTVSSSGNVGGNNNGILATMAARTPKMLKAPTISTQMPARDTSQTMAGNVANNLSGNGILMNMAAARGQRMAASRGLQNSTLGAEASQRAMIDAAMPIASQDTQNAFAERQTRLQSDLAYNNQSRLNQAQNEFAASQADLDRSHQRGMTQLQADLNYSNQSRLNQAQNQFAASQAELDRSHQRGMTQLQADLNYNNQSRLNQAQNQFTSSQTALDRQQQRDMANINHQNEMQNLNAQVSANTIGKSIDFTMQITSNFDAQIATILNNSNMKAEDKEKAIQQLKASRDSEIRFMSQFMQAIPTTRQNWSSFPSLGVPSVNIG